MLNRAIGADLPAGLDVQGGHGRSRAGRGHGHATSTRRRTPRSRTSCPGPRPGWGTRRRAARTPRCGTPSACSCNTVFARSAVRCRAGGDGRPRRGFGFNDAGAARSRPRRRAQHASTGGWTRPARAVLDRPVRHPATPLQMALVAPRSRDGGGAGRRIWSSGSPRTTARWTLRGHDRPVPRAGRQAMSPATAAQLRRADGGRRHRGHRHSAAIPGATVGGKTGTAQHGMGNSGVPYAGSSPGPGGRGRSARGGGGGGRGGRDTTGGRYGARLADPASGRTSRAAAGRAHRQGGHGGGTAELSGAASVPGAGARPRGPQAVRRPAVLSKGLTPMPRSDLIRLTGGNTWAEILAEAPAPRTDEVGTA